MKKITLGRTGVNVSTISLGTWSFGGASVSKNNQPVGWAGQTEKDSELALQKAYEVDDDEPNAHIDIVFNEKESSTLGRNLAIFIPIGTLGLLIVLGLISYGAYRMGVRKED